MNDTNDIFVILDPTTVNITTYVIPYNPGMYCIIAFHIFLSLLVLIHIIYSTVFYSLPYPDETQDVITGYFLIPDLKPEVVALLYNDSDSDVAKEIKDEVRAVHDGRPITVLIVSNIFN